MSIWIRWAIMLERTPQDAEMVRREMLREVQRLGLGFCDRETFQRYLEASS